MMNLHKVIIFISQRLTAVFDFVTCPCPQPGDSERNVPSYAINLLEVNRQEKYLVVSWFVRPQKA